MQISDGHSGFWVATSDLFAFLAGNSVCVALHGFPLPTVRIVFFPMEEFHYC